MDLKSLCTSLAELKKKCDLENWARAERKTQPDFKALSDQISKLMAEQDAMLATVPDSSEALATLHSQVMNEMEKEGVYAVGDVRGKFREKNEVNANKVLHALGGDWDLYLTLSNVTQTALKGFAAENPEMKKELLSCIEVTDRKLVDLAFETPVSPLLPHGK